jgi:hypothetical protein
VMKKLIFFILMLALTPALRAQVSTRVCLADGITPLELADPGIPFVYRPIMVGTHLTIIISSDSDGYWDGGELSIWDADRDYGILSGASQLPAAGEMAIVWHFEETEEVDGQFHDANGFRFGGDEAAVAGDWFIIDYIATDVGFCSVVFYDWFVDFLNPLYQMSFTHVSTRDFDDDGIVNFQDFAVLGSNWRRTDCTEPQYCSGADLDVDEDVGVDDLKLFAEYWLEKTR